MALILTLGWGLFLLVLAMGGAALLLRSLRQHSPAPRVLLLLLPFAAAMMLWAMWLNIADTPFDEWNSARVAPVVAWWSGFPLYYPRGDGPGTAFIYPPISAILRLPIAWVSSPTIAVIGSSIMNALLYHVPLFLFIASVRGPWLMRLLGVLIVWGFSIDLRSLAYSAYFVHADAPALGFGLVACMIVMRDAEPTRRTKQMLLAATFLALSIGSKQTQAPLLVILPAYVWLRHGLQPAMLLGAVAVAMLATMTLTCIGVWGADPILFNWFGIAAGQPWQNEEYGRVVSFLIWSGTLVAEITGPALAMVVLMLFMFPSPRFHARQRLKWLLQQPWFLPLVVSIAMAPLAIMSLAKRGGWGNSLSITTYYLSAAIGALIAGFRWRAMLRRDARYTRAVVSSATLLVIALAAWSVTPFTTTRKTLIEISNFERNPEQTAFEFARKYPGQAYFPRNPLATLMAEGRYYMFEFGMLDEMQVDKKTGEQSFTPQRISRYMPPQMKIIAIPPERTAGIARMEMPGFTERYEEPELPGWIVFRRPLTN